MKSRVLVLSLVFLSLSFACDEVKSSDSCGDGFLDPSEACDQTEFRFGTCADFGFYEQHGELACAADCALADGVCTGYCGDNEVQMDHGEECEGTDLNGNSCVGLGYSGGPLACDAACRYDISGCVSSCGNGIIDTGEDCDDGGREDGDGCSRLCAMEPGWQCTGVPSECATECGDGIAAGEEECDGDDLRGVACDSLGHWFGELGCDPSCALAKGACLDVAQLTAGEEHTCALLTNGDLWCWGWNMMGQLGDGTSVTSSVPVRVDGLPGPVSWVDAGGWHTCAVLQDSSAWCWGSNDHGQLGDGTLESRPLPVQVAGLATGVTQISCGGGHSCALKTDGSAVCWGRNDSGQVGNSASGPDELMPAQVLGFSIDSATVALGMEHSCARKVDGSLYCWGDNTFGQVGDGSMMDANRPRQLVLDTNSASLESGNHHACAIYPGGDLWCWGLNDQGQLGDGTRETRASPTLIGDLRPARIAPGLGHTCAIAGTVQCWGQNLKGQLGDGTTDDRLYAVIPAGLESPARLAAGNAHSCAALDDGSVWCWGWNLYGQLGDGTLEDRLAPVRVTPPSP